MRKVVLILAAVVGLVSGCAPTYQYPAVPRYSRPAPPTTDIDETKPHSVMRLVSVTPATSLPEQRSVTIDRRYTVKSEFLVSSWYTTRVISYIPKGSVIVLHRDVQFGFGFSALDVRSSELTGSEHATSIPLGLSLLVKNGSSSGVLIDWNAVTLIDNQGRVHGVVHRGVKMADRSGILAPSTIPPGAILDDFVYPREFLNYSGGRYGGGWLGVNFFERMKPGQQFKLYLPVKHGPEIVEYQFTFEISAPEEPRPAGTSQ